MRYVILSPDATRVMAAFGGPQSATDGYAEIADDDARIVAFEAPIPALVQQAAAALTAGCAITSTGTPALDGTYACDQDSQGFVQAEVISLLLNGTFTNGSASIGWPDAAGTLHTFDVAQFKALATVFGSFVGALRTIIATGSGTLPVQPSVIA